MERSESHIAQFPLGGYGKTRRSSVGETLNIESKMDKDSIKVKWVLRYPCGARLSIPLYWGCRTCQRQSAKEELKGDCLLEW